MNNRTVVVLSLLSCGVNEVPFEKYLPGTGSELYINPYSCLFSHLTMTEIFKQFVDNACEFLLVSLDPHVQA